MAGPCRHPRAVGQGSSRFAPLGSQGLGGLFSGRRWSGGFGLEKGLVAAGRGNLPLPWLSRMHDKGKGRSPRSNGRAALCRQAVVAAAPRDDSYSWRWRYSSEALRSRSRRFTFPWYGIFTPLKSIQAKFSLGRCMPERSGRISGFSSLHLFQTSTPCSRTFKCSGLATPFPSFLTNSFLFPHAPNQSPAHHNPPSRPPAILDSTRLWPY